ncbi:hypothetical protein [unidentified bacterial endosymbiont]|uniref:hypothetical protein n=1 Tax=unidentified bacterial endosymbiont TaxID=2355 RepID=UPI00209E4B5F|nr:hypothetical protein [unidentified bacterial endosymbiont]
MTPVSGPVTTYPTFLVRDDITNDITEQISLGELLDKVKMDADTMAQRFDSCHSQLYSSVRKLFSWIFTFIYYGENITLNRADAFTTALPAVQQFKKEIPQSIEDIISGNKTKCSLHPPYTNDLASVDVKFYLNNNKLMKAEEEKNCALDVLIETTAVMLTSMMQKDEQAAGDDNNNRLKSILSPNNSSQAASLLETFLAGKNDDIRRDLEPYSEKIINHVEKTLNCAQNTFNDNISKELATENVTNAISSYDITKKGLEAYKSALSNVKNWYGSDIDCNATIQIVTRKGETHSCVLPFTSPAEVQEFTKMLGEVAENFERDINFVNRRTPVNSDQSKTSFMASNDTGLVNVSYFGIKASL